MALMLQIYSISPTSTYNICDTKYSNYAISSVLKQGNTLKDNGDAKSCIAVI